MHKTPLLLLATLLFSTHTTSLWAPPNKPPHSGDPSNHFIASAPPPYPSEEDNNNRNSVSSVTTLDDQRFDVHFSQLSKTRQREELTKQLIKVRGKEIDAEKQLEAATKKRKEIEKRIKQITSPWQRFLQWLFCKHQ